MKGLRHSVGKRASEVAGHFEGRRQVLLVFQFSNIIAGAVHIATRSSRTSSGSLPKDSASVESHMPTAGTYSSRSEQLTLCLAHGPA